MGGDQFIVVGNKDGPESKYSVESATEAARVLDAPILLLEADHWMDQLRFKRAPDIFFLATHGGYSEDGTLQSYLESCGLRHTHSPAKAARIMSNKHETKLRYSDLKIRTPPWSWNGSKFGNAADIANWVCKPIVGGSKFGLSLSSIPTSDPTSISEECIPGKYETSVWLLGSTSKLIVLPPLLRVRNVNQLGKLVDMEDEPPASLAAACLQMAQLFHLSIGAHGLTKTDFVIDEQGLPWAIETDAHPALGRTHGAARQALRANLKYEQLIREIAQDRV